MSDAQLSPAEKGSRRWRRAALALFLAVPTLGFVTGGDPAMIILSWVTVALIAAVTYGVFTLFRL